MFTISQVGIGNIIPFADLWMRKAHSFQLRRITFGAIKSVDNLAPLRHARLAVAMFPPYFKEKEPGSYSGLDHDVWKIIADKRHYGLTYIPAKSNHGTVEMVSH